MTEGARLFPNLGVAIVIACDSACGLALRAAFAVNFRRRKFATWRCHASALFLGALTLEKIHAPAPSEQPGKGKKHV
jgi:hypothetical protein